MDGRVMTSHSTCGCIFSARDFFPFCNLRKRSDCLEAAAVWQTMHDPTTLFWLSLATPAGTDLDLKYLGVSGRLCISGIYFFINKIPYSRGADFMVVSMPGVQLGANALPHPPWLFSVPGDMFITKWNPIQISVR